MTRRQSTVARSARDEVMRRLNDLPYEDQLDVHRTLASWLAASHDEENPIDRQIRDRVRALEDLTRPCR